jgi:nucleoside-diphosphate-sugar epimerase
MTRLARDLDEILERAREDFETLRGARIFVTGGTGFVGSWLLESFVYANARFALGARVVVLTREPSTFARVAPHVAADDAVEFVRGDVRDFADATGTFDAIVHAATPASAKINDETPLLMVDTVVNGMRRVLDIAERSGRIPFLLTSSGAIYGRQPPELHAVDETFSGGPDPLDARNAYHESKRLSELLLAIAAQSRGVRAKIARLFAFVGPYLPLDRHFAIGNFIRDAMNGTTIQIGGDGTPVRSYLYAGDLTVWLWRVLARGESGRAYNVGSERAIDIRETARAVAACVEPRGTHAIRGIANNNCLPERYVPATRRARTELGLEEWTSLDDAIRRTIAWNRAEA